MAFDAASSRASAFVFRWMGLPAALLALWFAFGLWPAHADWGWI